MRKIGDDKKAQQLTIGTLIIIVLGIAVLAFLIYGFSTGWGNLWGKIGAYGGGQENVDTIKQACILACSSAQESQYCSTNRTVTFSDGHVLAGSCKALEGDMNLDSCGNLPGCSATTTPKVPLKGVGGVAIAGAPASTKTAAQIFTEECNAKKGTPKATCAVADRLMPNAVGSKYCCKP